MQLQQNLEQKLQADLGWLTSRRWFGDKARVVTDLRVQVADTVQAGEHRLILAVVKISYDWGEPTSYFVPLLDVDAPLSECDATGSSEVLRWFADGFLNDRVINGQGNWRWRRIDEHMPRMGDLESDAIHLISAEQSNSSIVFGEHAIGKLFRRVQPGINPDLEIGEHLMRIGSFSHAPDLYGVVELELDGDRIDIAALQQFVPNVGDGWSWLLQELQNKTKRAGLIDQMRLLGTRTGELHLALAQDFGDSAFEPEMIGVDEAQTIIRRVIAEMEASVEGLTHHLTPTDVETLHKGLGAMMADAWSMVGTALIRVHGDYHLGQTLHTSNDDFIIIDFEGEPSRTMAERRLKLPALKDVAGMVRSLDYAGATLIQQSTDEPDSENIAAWVISASDAFVGAYRKAISVSSTPLVPESDSAFNSVLNLMIAEKALYELRYEMNNRPDWLWIPLDALRRLVGMGAVD